VKMSLPPLPSLEKAKRFPSGENEYGHSLSLPSVNRCASPEPSERIQYKPGAAAFVDLKTMFFPSGVHTGQKFSAVRKLRREGLSRSRSFTQMSSAVPLLMENASRLPSGEKRGLV
jgi:hypothetical protein